MTTPSDSAVLRASRSGAWAEAVPSRDGWEVALWAGSGRLDVGTATGLLSDLVEEADGAQGTLRWRVPAPTGEHAAIARSAGFRGDRTLVQMRRQLPAPSPSPPLPTRRFVPQADEAEWLRVNNAAFSWHPEQGGWSHSTLRERLDEDWVDLDGFLLTPGGEPGAPIDGFCWTKVHRDIDPLVGEIFVIAVDPEAAGHGLGRRLVLAGLEWLHTRGCAIGMLYTESDNERAVGLYRDLGFAVHHEVQVFERAIAPQTPTPTSDPIP